MGSPRSTSLALGTLVGTNGHVYTAPEGYRVILKSAVLNNTAPVGATLAVGVTRGAETTYIFIGVVQSAAVGGLLGPLFVVMDPGDRVFLSNTAVNAPTTRYLLSGTLLRV